MLIYAVYDKKGCFYMPPFTVENKIIAIRGLEQEVNTSGSVLNRYPEDFALYFLGEFDNKKGKIKQPGVLVLECECMQLVRPFLKRADEVGHVEKSEPPKAE